MGGRAQGDPEEEAGAQGCARRVATEPLLLALSALLGVRALGSGPVPACARVPSPGSRPGPGERGVDGAWVCPTPGSPFSQLSM